MFGSFNEIRRKLRAERKQHTADLANANQALEQMQRSLDAAHRRIKQIDSQISDHAPSGQIVYPLDDAKLSRPNHQIAR
jgi:septal ring factor EnvC (AmiA/AmiB activator)